MNKRDKAKVARISDMLYDLGTRRSPATLAQFIVDDMDPVKAAMLVYMLPQLVLQLTLPSLGRIAKRMEEDEMTHWNKD